MKYLGIDYGEKRVGIAVSDVEGRMAFPKATLPNDRMLMTNVKDIIVGDNIKEIIIGESKAHSGKDNPVMDKIRQFVSDLERETGLAVHFEPEFYSSSEARMLKDQTGTQSQLIDAEAAAVILNSFLARSKEGDSSV